MIWKGQVYNRQAGTDFQQARPVLIVSGDASNHSEAASVTVLDVVPRRGEVEPEIEAAFELDGKRVKVWPYSLTVVPKEELEAWALGRIEGSQLVQIDTILAVHFGLSPASFEASAMRAAENEGEIL